MFSRLENINDFLWISLFILCLIFAGYQSYQLYVWRMKYLALEEKYHHKYDKDIQFLRQMNHVIRTPLNGILGFLELLQSKIYGTIPKGYDEYITLSLKSGQEMGLILERFSDYCKDMEVKAPIDTKPKSDCYVVHPELIKSKS